MKKAIWVIMIALLTVTVLHAQDIADTWYGRLKVQGQSLRLVFNITATPEGLSATMDSPDQRAFEIAVSSVKFENDTLDIAVNKLSVKYIGRMVDKNTIDGIFTQGKFTTQMQLERSSEGSFDDESYTQNSITLDPQRHASDRRPQDPIKPYPYVSEDITFENHAAGVTLAGTFSYPASEGGNALGSRGDGGTFPTVVLITGSGPQNRDEELLGHRPFLVLSDLMTRNGIAVLRYDDRGTAQSTGDFASATTTDLATDARAAVAYLKTRKEVNSKLIGLVGHSEGGIIAPMVAADAPQDVAYIVLLAGTGVPGDSILLMQQRLIGRADGLTQDQLEQTATINRKVFDFFRTSQNTTFSVYLRDILRNSAAQDGASDAEIDILTDKLAVQFGPWMQEFLTLDPAVALRRVSCPVLALNGEKDLQVPPDENVSAIKRALTQGKNPPLETAILANLNHLFQNCTTGAPSEYATIDETFSPQAMKIIVEWIKKQKPLK